MRFSSLGLMAGLVASALAEDVLFVDTFEFHEYDETVNVLGLTTKVVTEAEWRTMTTADFAAFKSIVIADPNCVSSPSVVQFLVDTKDTWGPAVQGNIVLIGTDPSLHFSSVAGPKVLIDNAIKFSAAGVSSTGASQTGLYFALSCYYDGVNSATVDALSYFGEFTVRGNLACYNKAHIVASSPALGTLDDAALSDWSCSVHEAFSRYPSVGVNGFQALAIAQDIIGEGSQTFGDGTVGLPYIISRGATPAGCGDGKWNEALGEECDDGNTVNGDGCSASCKCESGRAGPAGTCLAAPGTNSSSSSSSSSYISSTIVPYSNKTITATSTISSTSTFCPGPYVTPTVPKDHIIGVEIIVYVTVIEDCKTYGASTVTSYVTSACSTMHKPIWSSYVPGYPCYACAMSSEGHPLPTDKFITASVTSCLSPPASYTPAPPVIKTCDTCLPYTLSTCPAYVTPSSSIIYEVVAPTYSTHVHAQATTSAAVYVPSTVVVKPSASYTPKPTSTAAAVFTGAAKKMEAVMGVVAVGVMGAVVML